MKKIGAIAPKTTSSSPRPVIVRAVPIELCQFIKFGGLSGTGGGAKQLISAGRVLVNGAVTTQKGRKLACGDKVEAAGQTIVVALA